MEQVLDAVEVQVVEVDLAIAVGIGMGRITALEERVEDLVLEGPRVVERAADGDVCERDGRLQDLLVGGAREEVGDLAEHAEDLVRTGVAEVAQEIAATAGGRRERHGRSGGGGARGGRGRGGGAKGPRGGAGGAGPGGLNTPGGGR